MITMIPLTFQNSAVIQLNLFPFILANQWDQDKQANASNKETVSFYIK